MASKSSIIEQEQEIISNSFFVKRLEKKHPQLSREFCEDQLLHFPHYKAQLFREGRESVEDEPRTGGPKSATWGLSIESLHEFLRSDPCCFIEEIFKYTEISSGSMHRILKEDIGIRKVCAR